MKKAVTVIVPVCNGIEYTILCLKALYQKTNSELFNLIVVDNGSEDGSFSYLTDLKKRVSNMMIIRNSKNEGFARAINQGLDLVDSNYACLLNSDVIVSEGWLSQLLDCMKNSHQILNIEKVGLVGPATNNVAGRQLVPNSGVGIDQLDRYAKQFYMINHQNWVHMGFLSFFCVLLDMRMIKEVGKLDERFFPGGFEDNSMVLDASAKGWKAVMAGDTFVLHFGHKTFDSQFPEAKRGLANRDKFYQKYNKRGRSQKVVGMYRVKNADKYFQESLDSISPFVDEIVVLDDNSTDSTGKIAQNHPKVVKYEYQNLELNEARDREYLLQMTKERNPDWILVIDGDEVLSDGWTKENFVKLIYPVNPMTKGYIFRYSTFWNDRDYTRGDNVWRGMMNVRFFKNEPDQHIHSDHPVGFHCNSTPPIPQENIYFAPASMRIMHFGYMDREDRERKYEWYERVDTRKDVQNIGAKNYDHLVSERGLQLRKWIPNNSLALNLLVKDEAPLLDALLEYIHTIFDEIVVVDTGSTDGSQEICKKYGAKVYDFKWEEDFSAARNYMKSKTQSRWILHLDADEQIPFKELIKLPIFMEEEAHGYFFVIQNRHMDGSFSHSQNIRLFRNLPEVYYTGYAHETFDDCRKKCDGWYTVRTNVLLYHNGFMKGHEEVQKKLDMYYKMNEKQMKDFPDDARPVFSIAMHHLNNGCQELAIEFLKKAIEISPSFADPKQQLHLIYLNESRKYAKSTLKSLPKDHFLYNQLEEMIGYLDDQLKGYPGKVGLPAIK